MYLFYFYDPVGLRKDGITYLVLDDLIKIKGSWSKARAAQKFEISSAQKPFNCFVRAVQIIKEPYKFVLKSCRCH